jgi:hypothetical protein
MNADDYSAMLERHARERAELAQQLEATRMARAQERARAEMQQPLPPQPNGLPPMRPPLEAAVRRHEHNLRIQDEQHLGRLDQTHATARAKHDQEPTQAFDRLAQKGQAGQPTQRPLTNDPAVMRAWETERQQQIQQQREQEKAQRLAQGQGQGRKTT